MDEKDRKFYEDYFFKHADKVCIVAPSFIYPILNHLTSPADISTQETLLSTTAFAFFGACFGMFGGMVGASVGTLYGGELYAGQYSLSEKRADRLTQKFTAAGYFGTLAIGFLCITLPFMKFGQDTPLPHKYKNDRQGIHINVVPHEPQDLLEYKL